MEKNIFREKSVERVSSPEQLDAYLKVTSSKVWLILGAIIVLLVGLIIWGIVGQIETTEATSCYIESNKLYCYTNEEIANKIDLGTIIKLNDSDIEYEIKSITYLGQITNEYANFGHLINANLKDHVYELVTDCNLPDNLTVHRGKIIIETISPIKFVFN